MDYPISVPSVGLVDGKFVDEDPVAGTPGSLIPAQWGNAVTEEILNVIEAAGLVPSEVNNSQLILAIHNLIKGDTGAVLTDTGVAGAYAATNAIPLTASPDTGFVQRVRIANPNPGAATYAPDGLAAKPIYGLGLQPLQGGELPAGVAVFMYLVQAGVNAGNGAWILIESLGGAAPIAPASKSQHALQFGQVSGVVGQARNARASVSVAAATATFTADEVIVETALGGLRYCLANFNKTINLATVGAGGMDTGAVPASGFVGIYAIYNPTTGVSALLAVNATAGVVPEVYGGANMPAGYTASALISVWPTNASGQLVIGSLTDRTLALVSTVQLTVTTATSTPISATMGGIPHNAKRFGGLLAVLGSNVGAALQFAVSPLANVVGAKALYGIVQVASGQIVTPFDIAVITPRLAFYTATVTSGAFQYHIQMSEYTI